MKHILFALLPYVLLAVDARPARCLKGPSRRPSGVKAIPTAHPVSSAPSAITRTLPASTAVAPILVETPKPSPEKMEPKPISPPASARAPGPAPAPVPAPAPLPAPVDPPTSRSPVGLAMNYDSKANIPSFQSKAGWYYSWNLDPLPNTEGLEFVPMIWGGDAARNFDGKLPGGTTHVLGFNEPDIGPQFGGSNMAAGPAAELHKTWVGQVPAGVKIGAPAVARGGAKWLRDFNAACVLESGYA